MFIQFSVALFSTFAVDHRNRLPNLINTESCDTFLSDSTVLAGTDFSAHRTPDKITKMKTLHETLHKTPALSGVSKQEQESLQASV